MLSARIASEGEENLSWPKKTAPTGADAPEVSAITFTAQTATRDRDKVLDDAVGLVVAGAVIRSRDGVTSEVPLFGTGSAFVVSPTGHVITNRHVIEAAVSYPNSANQRGRSAQ